MKKTDNAVYLRQGTAYLGVANQSKVHCVVVGANTACCASNAQVRNPKFTAAKPNEVTEKSLCRKCFPTEQSRKIALDAAAYPKDGGKAKEEKVKEATQFMHKFRKESANKEAKEYFGSLRESLQRALREVDGFEARYDKYASGIGDPDEVDTNLVRSMIQALETSVHQTCQTNFHNEKAIRAAAMLAAAHGVNLN